MEHHRRLGIAPQVRDLCLPINRPTDVSYYTSLTGWELGRIPMPSEADKRRAVAASAATDQIPEPLLRANQMYVEAFLLAHARTRPEHHHPLRLAGRPASRRTTTASRSRRSPPARRESWRAQYLAGCDGGRSFVRRSLALRYHGFASLDSPHYGGRQNATYFRAPTLYRDHLAHRPGWKYWIVNPEGPLHHHLAQQRRGVPGVLQGAGRRHAADRRGAARMIVRAVGADLPVSDHRPLALDRGRRAGGRAIRRPAAWCWPATPRICSRRPAASA